MAYLEKRSKNGREYYYAKESYRDKGKTRTRTLSYLGKDRKLAEKKIEVINNPPLLVTGEQKALKELTDSYNEFQKSLDPITREQVHKDFIIFFRLNFFKCQPSCITK